MKVLFASIPQPRNRFVIDLKEGIEKYAEVIYDCDEFWACTNHYDIIHIHEPEYLSYEIERCMDNTNPIPVELWNRLIKCLEHWKKHSKIIHTRHVQEPHIRVDDEFRKLYKTVFSYCDGMAHFANFSIQQFREFYPDLTDIEHVVVPCHNSASLPNIATRQASRLKLGIAKDAKVMLVFGVIKEREKHMIQAAFDAIPESNKVLLAPGWKVQRPHVKWIRLREWIYKYKLWKASKNKMIRTNLGFVQEEDAQYYCNASDFLFIPRTDELNSGNITFGFTFGLVVVGKNDADIGEILIETGNPVFEVGNENSVRNAIIEALRLASQGQGKRNQELTLKECDVDTISKKYSQLFERVSAKTSQGI